MFFKKKISVSQKIKSPNSKRSAGVSASFDSARVAFQKITAAPQSAKVHRREENALLERHGRLGLPRE